MKLPLFPNTYLPIDWDNPITQGLVEWIQPAIGATAINRIVRTTSGTVAYTSAGSAGMFRGFTGTAARDDYRGGWSSLPIFSCLVVFKLNSIAVTHRIAGNWTSLTSGFLFSPNTSNFRGLYGGGGTNQTVTGSAVDLLHHAHLFTVSGLSMQYFEDGARRFTGNGSGVIVAGTLPLEVGDSSSSTTPMNGEVTAIGLWNRVLSNVEAYRVTAQPDLFLQRKPKRVYSIVASAATFNPGWAFGANKIVGIGGHA